MEAARIIPHKLIAKSIIYTQVNTRMCPSNESWHPQGHDELNDSSLCVRLAWVPNILLIPQQICTNRYPYTQNACAHTARRQILQFGSRYRSTLVSMSSITSTSSEKCSNKTVRESEGERAWSRKKGKMWHTYASRVRGWKVKPPASR